MQFFHKMQMLLIWVDHVRFVQDVMELFCFGDEVHTSSIFWLLREFAEFLHLLQMDGQFIPTRNRLLLDVDLMISNIRVLHRNVSIVTLADLQIKLECMVDSQLVLSNTLDEWQLWS